MPVSSFKGFDDWIEIFRGGTRTDSTGKTRNWTNEELDEIVANHNGGDPAPAVIGHPKHNDPAYGWTESLKRDGQSLYAKFKDVATEFEQWVKDGRIRNRSVKLGKTADGFRLIHVGWLGAAPPAVAGMPAVYSAPETETTFEYSESDWFTPSLLSRVLRRLRDGMIAEKGLETADALIPDYLVEDARRHADELRNKPVDEPEAAPAFSSPDHTQSDTDTGVDDMSQSQTKPKADAQFTQADIDAAVEQATKPFTSRESELQKQLDQERRERRRGEFQAKVNAGIEARKLTPAQSAGMVEFALALDDTDESAFEFSVGEGDKAAKQTQHPLAWFNAFIDAMPTRTGHLFSQQKMPDDDADAVSAAFAAPAGYSVDQDNLAIHNSALAYQAAHPGVDYLTAVQTVQRSH